MAFEYYQGPVYPISRCWISANVPVKFTQTHQSILALKVCHCMYLSGHQTYETRLSLGDSGSRVIVTGSVVLCGTHASDDRLGMFKKSCQFPLTALVSTHVTSLAKQTQVSRVCLPYKAVFTAQEMLRICRGVTQCFAIALASTHVTSPKSFPSHHMNFPSHKRPI